MPEPIQKMEPVTNPVLVDAMATFKVDLKNREHEKAFLEAAIAAKYLLPAQIEQLPDQANENGQVPTRIAFQIMTNPKGDKFMPAFTDEIELRKNRKEGEKLQIAVMDFRALHNFLKANEAINGIVINPFGSALVLVRQQVLAIGANNFQIVVQARPAENNQQPVTVQLPQQQQPNNAIGAAENNTAVQHDMIRQAMANLEADKAAKEQEDAEPAVNPITEDLLTALKTTLKKQKAVKKAYIKQDQEDGERYLLVALEADENTDIDAIGETVSSECADYSDLPFDCVAASSIRAKDLVAEGKPFYEKKRFGFF